MRPHVRATGWRRTLELLGDALLFVLKPLQIVGNFVFLSIAYLVGVGLSALLYRMGPRGKKAGGEPPRASLWRELPPAPADREAWLRPF